MILPIISVAPGEPGVSASIPCRDGALRSVDLKATLATTNAQCCRPVNTQLHLAAGSRRQPEVLIGWLRAMPLFTWTLSASWPNSLPTDSA